MFLLFVLPPRGSFFAPRGAFCGFSNKHLRVSMDLLTAVLHNALRHVLQRICTSKFEQTFAPLRHKLQQFLHHGVGFLRIAQKNLRCCNYIQTAVFATSLAPPLQSLGKLLHHFGTNHSSFCTTGLLFCKSKVKKYSPPQKGRTVCRCTTLVRTCCHIP